MRTILLLIISGLFSLSVNAQFDLKLETGYLDFFTPDGGYYYHPPIDDSIDIYFSGIVTNSGEFTAYNVFLEVEVYLNNGSTPFYSDSSYFIDSISPNITDTISIYQPLSLNIPTNLYDDYQYSVLLSIKSDSIEENTINNSQTRFFKPEYNWVSDCGEQPAITRFFEYNSSLHLADINYQDGDMLGYEFYLPTVDTIQYASFFCIEGSGSTCVFKIFDQDDQLVCSSEEYDIMPSDDFNCISIGFLDLTGEDLFIGPGLFKLVLEFPYDSENVVIGSDTSSFHKLNKTIYKTPLDTAWQELQTMPVMGLYTNCYSVSVSNIEDEISIYPNPTNNNLNIINSLNCKIELITLKGIIVFSGNIESNSETLNLKEFPPGIYIIRLTKDEEIITKKIVISN